MDKINQRTFIFYRINEEFAQQTILDNLGRELTEIELKRLRGSFLENEDVRWDIIDIIMTAAEDAIENSDGRWDHWDKMYADVELQDIS